VSLDEDSHSSQGTNQLMEDFENCSYDDLIIEFSSTPLTFEQSLDFKEKLNKGQSPPIMGL
jgi:hypothetical protein